LLVHERLHPETLGRGYYIYESTVTQSHGNSPRVNAAIQQLDLCLFGDFMKMHTTLI